MNTTNLVVPLARPKPDCRRFIRAVTTDYQPDRPPLIEYILDRVVLRPVIEQLGRTWVERGGDLAQQTAYLDNFIAFWHHMGYDIVRLEVGMRFQSFSRAGGIRGRNFQETGKGPIGSWEDFEKYPWPTPNDADWFALEYVANHLPEGMGLISNHAGGPLECMEALMGYEPLCLALYDQPDLVAAVAKRVGGLMEQFYFRVLQLPNLVAVFPGDDMGFRTGTLLAPDHLRRLTLPWHKKFAAMTHARKLPYFLHSCGQLGEIMPDLIDNVKIDAKHSYEDAIIPAADFKKKWGMRIGVLGGVDLNVLTLASPDELRKYVRKLIDACAPGGRYAFGSGNSIPDYIPPINYMTMIDEAIR